VRIISCFVGELPENAETNELRMRRKTLMERRVIIINYDHCDYDGPKHDSKSWDVSSAGF